MSEQTTDIVEKQLMLEERKVRALEKIGSAVDALTIWFEEIDKDDWDERMQYYLAEFHRTFVAGDE